MNSIPLIEFPRNTGYTTFIMKAMITNPYCTVVVVDKEMVHKFKDSFMRLVREEMPIILESFDGRKSITDHFFSERSISVVSIKEFNEIDPRHHIMAKKPVIFDNSCYCLHNGILIKEKRLNP